MLKNLLLILSLFISGEFYLQEKNKKDTIFNNQKLVGTKVDFELIENLDFPKFIEIEKDTFNDKVISLDTTKKISFIKEQVDLGIEFEEIPFEEKILFPEEPTPIKSSQFSELKITSKIIEELDIKKTIKSTSNNAGMLHLEMVPNKRNNVKVLLFFDIGGSMDEHIKLCSELFSAAKYEFKHMEHYYFHNCIYENLWQNNIRRYNEHISTYDILHKFNKEYKVIIVGDASMSPYEIASQYGSVEHYNEESGEIWMRRLTEQFDNVIWLNPIQEKEWKYTRSIGMMKIIVKDNMFPLTLEGIGKAIQSLLN